MNSGSGAGGGFVLTQQSGLMSKGEGHDGIMVALRVPEDVGRQLLDAASKVLPAEALQPLDELHVTLAYLGSVSDPGQVSDEENLEAILQQFVPGWTAIEGEFSGTGRFFNVNEDGDMDCIYASFDSPDLARFRAALVAHLEGSSVQVVGLHGFTPHCTLAYIHEGVPTPTISFEPIPVRFDALWEAWGDQSYDIPLGSGEKSLVPYKIGKNRTTHRYYVLNTDTGERKPEAGYDTRGEAESYMRALYANVEDAKKSSLDGDDDSAQIGVGSGIYYRSPDDDDTETILHGVVASIDGENATLEDGTIHKLSDLEPENKVDMPAPVKSLVTVPVSSATNTISSFIGTNGSTATIVPTFVATTNVAGTQQVYITDDKNNILNITPPEAAKRKKPGEMETNVTDQMADAAYNAGGMSADKAGDSIVNKLSDASFDAQMSDDGQHYAYPEEKKLPMPDAQHVVLAAAALGPNPPHGHGAQIPQDKIGQVKGRIHARARELGMSSEQTAKVNAYLSGHMPGEKMSNREVAAWHGIYEAALSQTGDENKAQLAALGSLNRASVMGLKAFKDGLPTEVEGWAMLFTNPEELDLQGTFFDDATRTLMDYYPQAPLWMEHGKDNDYGADPIGMRTKAQVFPIGVWLEHELHTDHPLYERTARDAADGAFSYSTDSLAHYAADGFDPRSGHLGEWPLAGCSLTRTPAEPGLGPIKAKSFATALKSVVDGREAQQAQGGVSQPSNTKDKQMTDQFAHPTQDSGEGMPTNFDIVRDSAPEDGTHIQPSALTALAEMYGTRAEPTAVRAALDKHIGEIKGGAQIHPELLKALDLGDDTPPTDVIEHLNNLYSHATQPPKEKDVTTEGTMAAPQPYNYGALHSHLHSGSMKSKGPYMTGSIAQKGINYNKGLEEPGVIETVLDMVRQKQGLGPKYRWNSAKAMTSATGPTGGYVLRQVISDDVLDPLRAQPVVFQLGAREEDMQGTQVKMVPAMQSAPSSNWIGENVAVTASQPSYRMVTLVPHGLQTTVQIPVNVEANMTPRAEKQLREQISLSQILALDLACLEGTGGNGQPIGILNTPNVRLMALATNGRAPTFQDIVQANGLLDDSNVPQQGSKRGLAFHSKIERQFTGQTDTLGRPLIRQDWSKGAESEIAGFPYRVSTQIPTNITTGTSTTTSRVYFADWRYLIVGLSDMVELRLSETFMQNLQIGLLAYVYADVKAAYPDAFIVMTGAETAGIAGVTVTTNTLG